MHFVFHTEDDFHIVLLFSIILLLTLMHCKCFCFLVNYVDCKNDGQIVVFSILLTRTVEIVKSNCISSICIVFHLWKNFVWSSVPRKKYEYHVNS